jgi:hypothetical protein
MPMRVTNADTLRWHSPSTPGGRGTKINPPQVREPPTHDSVHNWTAPDTLPGPRNLRTNISSAGVRVKSRIGSARLISRNPGAAPETGDKFRPPLFQRCDLSLQPLQLAIDLRQISLDQPSLQMLAPVSIFDQRLHLAAEETQPRMPMDRAVPELELAILDRLDNLLLGKTELGTRGLIAQRRTLASPLCFHVLHATQTPPLRGVPVDVAEETTHPVGRGPVITSRTYANQPLVHRQPTSTTGWRTNVGTPGVDDPSAPGACDPAPAGLQIA